jgi:hypothetical protein
MHPVLGQVSEYSIEPQRPVAGHVLQERDSGSYSANCLADVGPDVAFVIGTFPLSSVAERLARVAAGEDVGFETDAINVVGVKSQGTPVHLSEVTKIWHAWVTVREYLTCRVVDLAVPRGRCAEDALGGEVETAGARAERADPQHG